MQIEHSEYQDQLVRGLTHRMNNILTLFHGYVGLLMDNQKLDRGTLEGLGKIKEGARAASELMDRAQSLARPSSSVVREINLPELVHLLRPAFESFRPRATTITIHVTDEIPHIWADMSRVKTAIIELVRNACEAAPDGGEVRLEFSADAAPHGTSAAAQRVRWVSLTVIDNGPGIAPEMMERIFTPFFSTKKKSNATGLGLTVAQANVQQVGGILRMESAPGRTAFKLLLPSRAETG